MTEALGVAPVPRIVGQSGRQVSRGTIWTIGGLAPNGHVVDDGHGHLLRRGTHARVFSSAFLLSKPSPSEDLEKYHGRIALALNIDRVRRVLEFDQQPSTPGLLRSPQAPQSSGKTVWTGSGWAIASASAKGNPGVYWFAWTALQFKRSLIILGPFRRSEAGCHQITSEGPIQVLVSQQDSEKLFRPC